MIDPVSLPPVVLIPETPSSRLLFSLCRNWVAYFCSTVIKQAKAQSKGFQDYLLSEIQMKSLRVDGTMNTLDGDEDNFCNAPAPEVWFLKLVWVVSLGLE